MTGFRNLMMGAAGAAGAGGYAVDNSAMFEDGDSEYLTKTFSGAPTNQKQFTISGWYKRGNLGAIETLFGAVGASATAGRIQVYFDAASQLVFEAYHGSGWFTIKTTQVFRDPHAWYNIMCVYDVDNSTSSDRMRIYLNGSRITDFAQTGYPSSSLNHLMFSNSQPTMIGNSGDNAYFDGYIAEVVGLDGVALTDMSTVGETDDNGVWRPIDPTAGNTFSNNSFYLNFASSGADLGDDASGNSNDFTNNNSATQSGDSPTTNHCVWSPLTMDLNASSSLALSKGNLVVSNTASEDTNVHGSFGLSAGKWYFEVTVDTINEIFLGVSDATIASNANAKTEAGAFVLDLKNANKYNNDGGSSYGSAFTNGDVANVALDLDNGKIWIGKDGTYPNSGNPATGSNEMYSGISGTFFPFLSTQGGGTKQGTTNFGQSSFTTSAPSGFEPWNTAKLYEDAAPAIEDGSAHFQTSLYSGNSSTQTITQSGFNSTFQPDLIWGKQRTGSQEPTIFDAVSGTTKYVQTNSTAAEATQSGVTAFNSNGFALGSWAVMNQSSNTHVAWQWLAGNATSTPSGGSVSSTVSVNQTAGFSIVKWTGTGANATVAHGLGATPQVVIVKNRSAVSGWYVGHASAGFNYEVRLDETGARAGSATLFNETAPTSTVFTVGSAAGTNGNTNNMIAYCWCEKPGFSKFGSYEGNGNANGPYIQLGFKPAFLMVKNIDAAGGWPMYDNARTPGNPSDKNLNADQNGAEYSPDYEIDLLSNGFKIRDNQTYVNAANTYIYMAFAEHPFAGTTPATAR